MKPVMIPTTDVNSETAIVTAWRVADRSPVRPANSWPKSKRARPCWKSWLQTSGFLLRGAEEGEEVLLLKPLAYLFPTLRRWRSTPRGWQRPPSTNLGGDIRRGARHGTREQAGR